ncbi:hypothetical protein KM043_003543 [Ampulex compressa]|nr:hypothetical protein KM043_003543 [Ampulex compressa]
MELVVFQYMLIVLAQLLTVETASSHSSQYTSLALSTDHPPLSRTGSPLSSLTRRRSSGRASHVDASRPLAQGLKDDAHPLILDSVHLPPPHPLPPRSCPLLERARACDPSSSLIRRSSSERSFTLRLPPQTLSTFLSALAEVLEPCIHPVLLSPLSAHPLIGPA